MEGIGTVAAIGGFLLLLVLIWAVAMNKKRSRAEVRRTEEATHDLYERVERQDQASDPDPKRY